MAYPNIVPGGIEMNQGNQKKSVTYEDIKTRYIDPMFGGNDVDDDVSLLPSLGQQTILTLLDTIAHDHLCQAVREITFDGDDRISTFCRRVASCINRQQPDNEPEGIIR